MTSGNDRLRESNPSEIQVGASGGFRDPSPKALHTFVVPVKGGPRREVKVNKSESRVATSPTLHY